MAMVTDETLQEILSRLPIRSLMKCRLVCRRLRDLTHGLHFTRIHKARTLPAKPGIMFNTAVTHDQTIFHHSEFFYMDRRITAPRPSFFSVPLSISDITNFNILNSCNGLLLLKSLNDDSTMFVCNPFIRKFIMLPDHEYPTDKHFFTTFDFGFCPKTESYKVLEISIWCINSGFYPEYRKEIYVHKLGDNSWNHIENEMPIITRRFGLASNINGALHWVDRYSGASLTVFELEHDVFKQMSGPLSCRGGTFSTVIIENCLSLINHYDNILELWIMKEYWISWEKCWLVNLSPLGLDTSHMFKVLNYAVQGSEFLILHNEEVLTYNMKGNVCNAIITLEGWDHIVFVPHYDTLVSPLD